MMTLLLLILFFGVFGKLAGFAFRMTWNMMKFMLMIMIVPVIIVAIVGGLVRIALPILVIVGIVYILRRETA
ncbi:MAG: hypothetical protein II842_13965 [Butyrivibrio sp.]|nr:hypothetical protein [Butyrivibrio sp.]